LDHDGRTDEDGGLGVATGVVEVAGLTALRKDISRLTEDQRSPLYQSLKNAGYAAAQPVATRTRATIPRGQRTSGRLQNDVRVSGARTGASVRMGRASVPYAGWIEFGGSRPDRSTRPYQASGRYLFPAAYAERTRVYAAYSKAIEQVFGSDRIWTNATNNPGSVTE
jgi:hypothetical protein